MNIIAEEIKSYYGISNDIPLTHYGTKRHSGRYPWGSGDKPFQHAGDFRSRVKQMTKDGFTYTDPVDGKTYTGQPAIARYFGMSTTELRAAYSVARELELNEDLAKIKKLQAAGWSTNAIAKEMGRNESSIRSILNEDATARRNASRAAVENIKAIVDEKGMVDCSAGVEIGLGISPTKMKQVLYMLESEGYPVYNASVPQITNPGRQTVTTVVGRPGMDLEHGAPYDYENVHSLEDYISYDNGDTIKKGFVYPSSLDSKRLQIVYAEDGGKDKDGLIELRRNVPDLDMGDARYAQIRMLVDDHLYLKGMAVYSDDLPDGVDVRFNSNKSKDKGIEGALKKIKDDPNNPFGSNIKEHGGQSYYTDENGEEKLSLINKRAEEGDWGAWGDSLPSQFLAKQPMKLINKQLDLAKQDKMDEYNDILSIENPTIRKYYLKSFSEDCDAAAEELAAAALPRQKYQVLIPLKDIKDNEVYAPNYENGETVALVRFPHGGTFEIPILKVNNKNEEGKKYITPNAQDAVGINANVAARLSGADFDGDTVMVIPCNSDRTDVKIKSTAPLEGLKNFDPSAEYPEKKGMVYMRVEDEHGKVIKDNTQIEMGKVSNLITDMTLKGAPPEDIAKATRHSMVVIDAGKHKLNYKQSEADNDIAMLKDKYQGHYNEKGNYSTGASTLISAAKSETRISKTVGAPKTDPETGKLVYKVKPEYYTDKSGKTQERTVKSTRMRDTDDARTLISEYDTPEERAYADYANFMKDLANKARLQDLNTKDISYNKNENLKYKNEVDSIISKTQEARSNAPREREAQRIAYTTFAAKKQDNPNMTKDEEKKEKDRALRDARNKVGASRLRPEITEKEYEAINSGAVSSNRINSFLFYADSDSLGSLVFPKNNKELSQYKQSKIKSLTQKGYTNAQIAKTMGVSVSTVRKYQ